MKRKVLSILLTLSILSLLVTCTVTPFYLLIDLNQALALLKQYLCLPETSTGTETNRAIYLGINLHTGDVILEDNPFNAGFQTTVGQEAFFFVLDEDPLARLAHVLRYLLVARSDGSILLNQLVKWTPLVNGVAVMSAELFDPTTGLLWQNYPGNQLTPSARSQIRAAPVKDVTNEVEGAIVVNGNNPAKYPDAGISKDAENMKGFYDSFAPMSEVEALDPPDNTESDLEGAIEDMYVAGVEDLTIYIATHGGSDMVVMGSSTMTAAEFADTIAEYPDMTFKVILDSCKSGSFMDELSTLPNVAIALTSTSATQSAYGDIDGADDPNPDDEGGEWTSGFLEDLEDYSADWELYLLQAELFGISPKVFLYSDCFNSAWEKDCARIKGLSTPQRYSPDF
ncbi:MAG: hypothetical protein KBC39_08040 [Thermotogae bacterium]|nr:hypothetical protein [Thermotogota bacterium]HPB86550.1 C13 family peptidase [Thermotogota bacterium]HQN21753.1 C13 family peptidase [Thermotogota bacterium]HQQ65404.1 C13 family peptidase [Thermotogota bacterium]